MVAFSTRAVVGMVSFMLLDFLWLGLLMGTFYRERLAPIARVSGDRLAPNWGAALIVYVLLGIGVAAFVPTRDGSPGLVLGRAALLGLVVYGVYDFTNYSTLRDWPLSLALVDMAWGGVATAACAWIVRMLTR